MRLVLVVAMLAAGTGLAAQGTAPDSTRCAELLAHPTVTEVDSLVVTVVPNFQLQKVKRPAVEQLATSVGTALQLPRPIVFPPVYNASSGSKGRRGKEASATQIFHAEAAIVLGKAGEVASMTLNQSSMEPSLDSALLAAVRGAVEWGLAPEFAAEARRREGGYISVYFFSAPADHFTSGAKSRPKGSAEVVVGAVRVPVFEDATGPRQQRVTHPRYPEAALAQGSEGKATFEFVIGTDGRAIPGTVSLLGESVREFAMASLPSVLLSSFEPGRVAGCPVPMIVQQPYTFRTGARAELSTAP